MTRVKPRAELAFETPFKADVVRDRGTLARLVEDGRIENVYRVQLINATEQAQRFHIEVEGLPGATLDHWQDVDVGPTEARWVPVAVQIPPQSARDIGAGAHTLQFRIALVAAAASAGGKDAVADPAERREKSTFVVPR